MKKILIVIAVLAVFAVTLGVSSYAYAQTTAPAGACPGGCTGPAVQGGRQGGMMGRGGMAGGRVAGTPGALHEYMLSGFSSALGISEADLQARLDAGETMFTISGKTAEEFQVLMQEVRTSAVEQAVAAGTLTQEQADWMAQRWSQMQANGYGPGSQNCTGLGTGRPGRGGRWNAQP